MTSILILETSTEKSIASLIKDDNLIFLEELPQGLQSSHYLLPELQKALNLAKISLQEISCIALGIGPGSYTGIRVGATVAKTLSFALNIPIATVCTLQAFVPPLKDTCFAAVIDAKVGGVYLQIGEMVNGLALYREEPKVVSLIEATCLLEEIPVIVTPSFSVLRTKMHGIKAELFECYPSPFQMATIAKEKYLKGDVTRDGHLELLYMRKTQAEIERENSKKTQGFDFNT